MFEFKAHFDGRAIVPDEPVELSKGQKLVVRVDTAPPPLQGGRGMTGKELAESDLVGIWKDRQDIGDSLEFARELRRRAERRER